MFTAFVNETVSRLRGPFLAHHPTASVLGFLEEAFNFAKNRPVNGFKAELRARNLKGLAVITCMEDQPFIVDTLRLFLRNGQANYWGGFNLVFHATRDENGLLIDVGSEGGVSESLVMLEADRGKLMLDVPSNQKVLNANLAHARAMVADFRSMTRSVERMAERCEVLAERNPGQADAMRETSAFLNWLLRDNFVFMGANDGTAMGIQVLEGPSIVTADGEWAHPHEPGTVRVRKSAIESPVHRSGRIDEILVTIKDVGGEERSLFLRGMFTYRAVTQPSRNVPILRRVLASILADQDSRPGSFRYKGFANVFDSLPTEFLFTAPQSAIAQMVDLVFESEQQQEVGVTFLMTGADTAFCLVAMPKTQFSDDLRRLLETDIVTRLQASYCDHGIFVGRYDTVLLHYFLTGIDFPGNQAVIKVTEQIRQLATPWLARLWTALADKFGESKADRFTDTYGRAFPDEWSRRTSAERAVRDIELLEQLSAGTPVVADVYIDPAFPDMTHLRLYESQDVNLTDILPVLDNFGLVVHSAYATEVNSRGGALHLDTFRIEGCTGCELDDVTKRADLLVDGLRAVFDGQLTNDRLNGLVLRSGLTWQEVDVIRGYARYARQLDVNLGAPRVQDILLANPVTCGRLVELFAARFDPDLKRSRARAITNAVQGVSDELRLIQSHDAHLVVSALFNLIQSTVRTNHYRQDRLLHYLSFKLDCSKVTAMGPGRPMWEIYVHNRLVEGVHLRFGMVARGGLRWSDRDDFRTEVLGLATTQQVKNTVIVPTGAKGGYYLTQPSSDRAIRRREADTHYKTFIRGLLDVTDNNVNGEIVPPPRVVRHDGDDPYLVVAADKGTAHLSDVANAISLERSFWMGDGFASGGSNGYDHKAVGITARGAWRLVRRHFAERSIHPNRTEFTAVGIGDMGGDVFGNGMVESDKTLLKAAFNHLHIFLDPSPNAAKTYVERKRLFECQGGWDKYDTKLISKGGGIFDRRHKSVPLSPEAQAMLGIDAEEAAPEVVIHHILQMDVHLLWNGGIGTYVKASFETHSDASDRGNNKVRVNATQIRAKIIGEGGNMGMTQFSRIEADLNGVALNTDAIDNSAGVDMSDHEVNLKILLSRVIEREELTQDERNILLAEMTDEVADLVLANNDAHGRQISRDVLRSKQDIWQFARAIDFIEQEFGREREQLWLPDNDELTRRHDEGLGLSRPELAVLSAWVKMYVFRELLADKPKDLPGYDQLLFNYFPKTIQEKYPNDIRKHMLADEIAMTEATTRIIADAGAAFVPGVIETTGATVLDVATAYFRAQYLARTHLVREELEELRTSVSLIGLYRAWNQVDAGARDVARYWLSTKGRMPTEGELKEMAGATSKVFELQASEVARRNKDIMDQLRSEDITDKVAERVLKAQYMNDALMVWAEARETDTPFAEMVVKHLAIAQATRLGAVLEGLARRPAAGRWDPIAMRILYNRFHALLREAVVLTPINGKRNSVDSLVPRLVAGPLAEIRDQVDRMLGTTGEPANAATLLVLEERLARTVQRIQA